MTDDESDDTTDPLTTLRDPEEARRRLVEDHDLEADAEGAHELLEEAVSLWDDLDDAGRVMRLRKAWEILDRTLERQRMRVEMGPDVEGDAPTCPDCGSMDLRFEDKGRRFFCTECDATLQSG